MKSILANFIHVLSRFKTSSILNIVGLSAAIFIFLVVAIQVHYDLTFNASFKDVNEIYQYTKLIKNNSGEKHIMGVTSKEIGIVTGSVPEIYKHCYLQSNNISFAMVHQADGTKAKFKEYSTLIAGDFNDIFEVELLEGSLEDATTKAGNTMISRKTAERMFGKESPIGKVVDLPYIKVEVEKNGGSQSVSVTGGIPSVFTIKAVYEDFPKNSTLDNGFFAFLPTSEYISYSQVFIKTKNGVDESLKSKINSKEIIDQLSFVLFDPNNSQETSVDNSNSVELIPLRNIHINYPTVSSKGQEKNGVYFLVLVGFCSLLIAYINFINFATAMAPARVRAINISMIHGASKSMIRFVLSVEAVLFTFISFALALMYLYIFQGSALSSMLTAKLDLLSNISLISTTCSILLIISFIVGIYPSYYITDFNTSAVLNNSSGSGVKSSGLRNILIVIQLTAAIIFTTSAIFIKMQHSYMTNYTLGFEKEHILTASILEDNERLLEVDTKVFVDEVMRNPIIESYTASHMMLGYADGSVQTQENDGEIAHTNTLGADERFFDFFNIPIVEGQNFTDGKNNEGVNRASIVNEQFLKVNNIKPGLENAQKSLMGYDIIGICKNFHYSSLLKEIGALKVIRDDDVNKLNILYFKPAAGKNAEAREHLNAVWRKFSKAEPNIKFFDESLEQLYKTQANMSMIVSVISLIIIIIAMMGVYGLITFNTKYRMKEIAIRRVNGSEIADIIFILNRSLFIQFCIAFVVAIPIVYYIMGLWIQQFPFRIVLSWWVFLLGGLIVLAITLLTVTRQSYSTATANPIKALRSE